jgi:hypothetical protein
MKYLSFIVFLLITPVVALCTIGFIFGMFAEEWLDLGHSILNS